MLWTLDIKIRYASIEITYTGNIFTKNIFVKSVESRVLAR